MQLRSEHIASTVHLRAFPPIASLAIDEKSCGPEAEPLYQQVANFRLKTLSGRPLRHARAKPCWLTSVR